MEENIKLMFQGFFTYRNGELCAERVPVRRIVREQGTPVYIYSAGFLRAGIERVRRAFAPASPMICYSMKANGNRSLLRLMRTNGLHVDVVSGGELAQALAAGFAARSVVFAGVGKRADEIDAAVRAGIYCFNVENRAELDIIERAGRRHARVVVCNLRLNLDIDLDTHHYVKTSKKEAKFGLDLELAAEILKTRKRFRYAVIKGFHFHLGSTIKEPSPYVQAIEKVAAFSKQTGFVPEILDLGGGFGIPYTARDKVVPIASFGRAICRAVRTLLPVKTLILEPGRYLVGNSALLVASVLYFKERPAKRFVIVDAGMNDLIRPALYQSVHTILPVVRRRGAGITADVVGPVCESGDYFGQDVRFAAAPRPGEMIAVANAGAYGFSMSSNYNGRPRPPEILVDGSRARVIRKREALSDLWRLE